jgi:outer membrane protein
LFAAVLVFLIAETSQAADLKFGVVNVGNVFKKSVKIKIASEEIQKIQSEGMTKIGILGDEVKKLEEKMKSGGDKMPKEEQEKIQNEIKEKNQDMESQKQETRVRLQFKQKSIQSVINTKLNEAVEKTAKEEGMAAVFRTESVMYSEGLVDLTDKVAKALDESIKDFGTKSE